MYRRRRKERAKIGFGFDSFLDLIANVIGIIMRLILVAWVGARAFTTNMEWKEEPPPEAKIVLAETATKLETKPNPLEKEIAQAQKDLDDARRKLLAYLDQLGKSRVHAEVARSEVDGLKREQYLLLAHAQKEERARAEGMEKITLAALSLDRLQERSQDLLAQIKVLEKEPAPKKVLRYRTPMSRVVDGEELMFECRGGKVSYIDLPAFLHEIKNGLTDDKIREIARDGGWDSTTASVGAFRLRFSFQAAKSLFSAAGSVRIQLASWTVEPITPIRGEAQDQALKANSEFRRLVDRLDPSHTTVTFWVYPDSFPLFRALRDHLYDDGVDVAGRPLPADHPIGASIHGTKSRGQ